MIKVILPKNKIVVGGDLWNIANSLNIFGNAEKSANNGDVVYSATHQELFENILTHENVMLIVAEGGDISNYIMIAELSFEKDGKSIYNCVVPAELPFSTIKITDGTQIIEAPKKLGQWANAKLTQKFSEDFTKIYVETCPLSDWLTGKQMKVFVDGFNARLLTRQEFAAIKTI